MEQDMKRPSWTWGFPRLVYVSINASSAKQLLLRSYPKLGKAVGPGGYAVVVSWRTLCRRSIVYPIGLIGNPSHWLTHLRSNASTNTNDLSADNPRMVHGSARSSRHIELKSATPLIYNLSTQPPHIRSISVLLAGNSHLAFQDVPFGRAIRPPANIRSGRAFLTKNDLLHKL